MKAAYIIPIRPKPKQRPRFSRGHAYTPRDTVEYEKALAMHCRAQGASPRPNPCIVSMSCYWKRPKSVKPSQFFTKRPDIDNLAKGCLDALNGVCWVDDAQIVDLRVSKDYGEDDKVVIEVEYLQFLPS